MLMATLAIAGAPLFSGFFSKDAILFATYASGQKLLWALGTLGAVLTAFYMFRLLFLTFHGRPRFDEHTVHVHESPRSMLAPLVALAVLSVAGGWMAAPKLWGGTDYFEQFLAPVLAAPEWLAGHAAEELHKLELALAGVAVLAAAVGFFAAWWLYLQQPQKPGELAARFAGPYRVLLNKYYVDELYAAVVVRPLIWFSDRVLWRAVDAAGIDGAVNGAADAARRVGDRLRHMQSGNARSYAAWVILGAAAITTLLVWLVR
jgi:NADH-quinone oxidoreductase subunit L